MLEFVSCDECVTQNYSSEGCRVKQVITFVARNVNNHSALALLFALCFTLLF
jgi:hypothetical protein